MGDGPIRGDIVRKGGRRRPNDWRYPFLEMLAKCGQDIFAAEYAGVRVATARAHYKKFPRFRAAWDVALEKHKQRYEFEVADRALDRKDPMSGTLLIFKAKAERPEKYRDIYKAPEEREALTVAQVMQLFEEFVADSDVNAFHARVRVMLDDQSRRSR